MKDELHFWDKATQRIDKLLQRKDPPYELLSELLMDLSEHKEYKHSLKQEEIFVRGGEALIKCISSQIEPQAENSLYNMNKEEMVSVLELSAKYNHKSENISKIEYYLNLPEEEFIREELKNAIKLNVDRK